MPPAISPEPRAVVLGVAAYVALLGWLTILPLVGFMLLHAGGGEPPFGTLEYGSLAHWLLAFGAVLLAGYVTGRFSRQAPMFNAALLGVALYLVVSILDRLLSGMFGMAVPFDFRQEVATFLRIVMGTLAGGAVARWQRTTRGAAQVRLADFSRRARLAMLVVVLFPVAFLAFTYRA